MKDPSLITGNLITGNRVTQLQEGDRVCESVHHRTPFTSDTTPYAAAASNITITKPPSTANSAASAGVRGGDRFCSSLGRGGSAHSIHADAAVKIKLDENLPARLGDVLSDLGHDVDTVIQERLAGHSDAEVWEAAQRAERFLTPFATATTPYAAAASSITITKPPSTARSAASAVLTTLMQDD